MIDESNKKHHEKYLHMLARYYSEEEKHICTEFHKAVTVMEGSSSHIVEAIKNAFNEDNIHLTNIIHIMSDSPNVMRGQHKGVIVKLKEEAPQLIDFGGCSLHHIHNAVSYACESLGSEAEYFADDIFLFFKYRTSLYHKYQLIQQLLDLEEHKILRYVSSRWMSLLPVTSRLIEQWDALVAFFTDYIPKHHSDVAKQDRTLRIVKNLQNPIILLKLSFLTCNLPMFNKFEKRFQKSRVMIHLLYKDMFELMTELLVNFIKPNLLESLNNLSKLQQLEYGKLSSPVDDSHLAIGMETKELIKNLKRKDKITDAQLKEVYLSIRSFFKKATEKLLHYLPLNSDILRYVQFLSSENQKKTKCQEYVTKLAGKMKSVIDQTECSSLEREWRLYAMEDIE